MIAHDTDTTLGGRRAIVIGGSIAGLAAARILSEHFEHVTIIDRDQFPADDAFRAGVPQARHAHVLMIGGMRNFEQLFPGLIAELREAGAPTLDQTANVNMLTPTGWAPQFTSGLQVFPCSRSLLEARIRRRTAALANVQILSRHEVSGLVASTDGRGVAGVQLRQRGEHGPLETLYAELVVAAGGRNQPTAEWLLQLGYPQPATTIVDANVGYASRWYELANPQPANRQALWIVSRPPALPRGGMLLPLENGKYLATLFGWQGQHPATDEQGFLNYARSLADPAIADVLAQAHPISPVYGYRDLANRLVHFDKLSRWPENFVVLGDAVCSFNPTYGQGMSVAMLSALALQHELRSQRGNPSLTGLARRAQRRIAGAISNAWMLATAEDLRWPGTTGARPDAMIRVLHWYSDQLAQLYASHPEFYQTFLEVLHMLAPTTALFRPAIVGAVISHALRRRGARRAETLAKTA